jgi:hypothetical protein
MMLIGPTILLKGMPCHVEGDCFERAWRDEVSIVDQEVEAGPVERIRHAFRPDLAFRKSGDVARR